MIGMSAVSGSLRNSLICRTSPEVLVAQMCVVAAEKEMTMRRSQIAFALSVVVCFAVSSQVSGQDDLSRPFTLADTMTTENAATAVYDPATGNLSVTSTMIPVYQCPSARGGTGPTTNYMLVTGPGTVFEGGKATKISEIRDGTANTLLVVEVVGASTNWAEPVDLDAGSLTLPFGGGAGSPGSNHLGGINSAFCDGSVHFLADTMSPAVLNALITKSGREATPSF